MQNEQKCRWTVNVQVFNLLKESSCTQISECTGEMEQFLFRRVVKEKTSPDQGISQYYRTLDLSLRRAARFRYAKQAYSFIIRHVLL
jgi:hypothetical protein